MRNSGKEICFSFLQKLYIDSIATKEIHLEAFITRGQWEIQEKKGKEGTVRIRRKWKLFLQPWDTIPPRSKASDAANTVGGEQIRIQNSLESQPNGLFVRSRYIQVHLDHQVHVQF